MDTIVPLISKLLIGIFITVDIIKFLQVADRKPAKPFIGRLIQHLPFVIFLVYMYFFFVTGLNSITALYKEENMAVLGGWCSLISISLGRYIIDKEFKRNNIHIDNTLRGISRMIFYPAMAVIIYLVQFSIIVIIRKQILH